MNRAMWVAKTGLDAQQTRLAVISNNLANVNTTGFKRGRAVFEDLIYQNIRQVGAQGAQNAQLPTGLQLGAGVRTVATEKIFYQGSMINSGNKLDVAIQGRGFFQIQLPDGGVAYSRDGRFQVNAEGQMVTAGGYEVLPGIAIPEGATNITISRDGIVSVTQAGEVDPIEVGNIELADFINPAGLEPMGENLFTETAASGAPQLGLPNAEGRGSLIQGFLEGSNVNTVEELVNMIEAQRAYEMNSKSISTADAMLQFVTSRLGG